MKWGNEFREAIYVRAYAYENTPEKLDEESHSSAFIFFFNPLQLQVHFMHPPATALALKIPESFRDQSKEIKYLLVKRDYFSGSSKFPPFFSYEYI